MHKLYLALAIVSEIIATTALKSSESFTRTGPSLVVVAGYGAAFYLLSLCLEKISVGAAYAVWSGMGIVLIALVGAVFHKQALDLAAVVGMALIVVGVIVLNLFSKSVAH
jgi:small multidrug resistance pump